MPDPFVKDESEIHENKVMLSVWWGVHEIYRFELLPDNTTVIAEVYCAQLQRLAWRSDGKFYRTHRTPRTWLRATTTSSDRFSITWKRSATMTVTSKMTLGLSSPPSRWQKVVDVDGDYLVE
ncbi:hypothetical protein RB195_022190 [Necator americanus]|uniref:Dipeptidylpeptidase IV N-terminal domain-containing protein n=1 Tax=Necator americanus TaxID=51031 RepID=A0ABR1EEA2_NECAM